MSDLTVDDILSARPSLRDRALKAVADAKDVVEKEKVEKWNILRAEALLFAREILGIHEQDLNDIRFEEVLINSSDSSPAVIFTVEGIKFRAKMVRTKVFETKDHEAIYDDKVLVEIPMKRQSGWTTVRTLEDVGVQLPDRESL